MMILLLTFGHVNITVTQFSNCNTIFELRGIVESANLLPARDQLPLWDIAYRNCGQVFHHY